MIRIYATFVRHANYAQPPGVPSALLPHPLTAEGREQARALAGELQDLVDALSCELHGALHTSSLRRAWETAELARAALLERGGPALEIAQTPALFERALGSLANLTQTRIEEIVADDPRHGALPPDWKATAAFKLPYPGCESLAEAGERVAGYAREVCEEVRRSSNRDTLVVFVGHGAAIRHGAASLGLFDYTGARAISMYYAKPVTLLARPEGAWEHVTGDWKPRGQAAPRD